MQARVGRHPSRRGFAAPQDEVECVGAHNVKQPRIIGRVFGQAPVRLSLFFLPPNRGQGGVAPLKKGERSAERRINKLRQRRQACAKLAAFGVDIPDAIKPAQIA